MLIGLVNLSGLTAGMQKPVIQTIVPTVTKWSYETVWEEPISMLDVFYITSTLLVYFGTFKVR